MALKPTRLLLALLAVAAGCLGAVEVQPLPAGGWQLARDGAPFALRAVAGRRDMALLTRCGGNAIRIRAAADSAAVLEEARRNGLVACVALRIDPGNGSHDAARELQRCLALAAPLKANPALLLWILEAGRENEPFPEHSWPLLEQVAAGLRAADPAHPVVAVAAPASVAAMMKACPAVSLPGLVRRKGIETLAGEIKSAGWDRAYLVAEWGSDGLRDVPRSPSGAELEPGGAEKAAQLQARHAALLADAGRCLGGILYSWDPRHERSPTWSGLLLESGRRTQGVEVLARLWGGRFTGAPAPQAKAILLNGKPASAGFVVAPGKLIRAELEVEGQVAKMNWQLFPELQEGGPDISPAPLPLRGPLENLGNRQVISFIAPAEPGAYRLLGVAQGRDNSAGSASYPFIVK